MPTASEVDLGFLERHVGATAEQPAQGHHVAGGRGFLPPALARIPTPAKAPPPPPPPPPPLPPPPPPSPLCRSQWEVAQDAGAKRADGQEAPGESAPPAGVRCWAVDGGVPYEQVVQAAERKVLPARKLNGETWEEPRQKSGLSLVGEMAPAELGWTYPVMDESRRTFAAHLPRVLSEERCRQLFDVVFNNTPWSQPLSPLGPIPRKTAWMVSQGCSCSYRYGRVEVEPCTFLPWMGEVMQTVMPLCGLWDPALWPNACNLNVYQDQNMCVGWHSDDEPLFQGRFRDCLIVSLSLGATRAFEVRLNFPGDGEQSKWRLPINNGDLMTMEGLFQKHYKHRVPKESRPCGPRINLTWRWIKQHTPECQAAKGAW